MNEIVVGVDRSERSREAAARAAQMARGLQADLRVMMCVDRHESGLSGSRGYGAEKAKEHQQFLDELCDSLAYPRITNALAAGHPAPVLCDEAERLGAQMIVVGNRRMKGAVRALGSVAGDVSKHAPCDVLIVHTER